jgi:hypothetical protein
MYKKERKKFFKIIKMLLPIMIDGVQDPLLQNTPPGHIEYFQPETMSGARRSLWSSPVFLH